MIDKVEKHIPKFVDHVGVETVYKFFEKKIVDFDMLFMDSIYITNWRWETSKKKKESQYLSSIRLFKLGVDNKIISRAHIRINIVQNFKKYKESFEMGSIARDEVPLDESAQELQVYATVLQKYPEHFNQERVTRKLDDFFYDAQTHYYHIKKETKFESKAETIIWNLGHCMYWYLKALKAIKSRKSETSANRFAFLWLYEFRGETIDWERTEFYHGDRN